MKNKESVSDKLDSVNRKLSSVIGRLSMVHDDYSVEARGICIEIGTAIDELMDEVMDLEEKAWKYESLL